jgi:hypothetical protein
MTAGVFRPYTLVDVLGTLNEQSQQQQGSTITSQGFFAETDEGMTAHDTMTTAVQANAAWDAGQWGAFTWS